MDKYETIARIIATIHIGITVLLRYPRPNGLNSPSELYANPGLIKWKMKNNTKNKNMAKLNL